MKIVTYASVPILALYLGLFFYKYNSSFNKEEFFEKLPKLESKEAVQEVTKQVDETLENYIVGVVACEMPASYNEEALKAQAVAARSFAYYKMKKENFNEENLVTSTDQCYINDDAMKEKWGNTYDKYKTIITNVVKNTEGIIIKKNNDLFKTYYFSTSNGYTENGMTVFKSNDITSVSSPWDTGTSGYKRDTTFTKKELVEKLGDFTTIDILSRNKTNHVEKVHVGSKTYTGIEFRKLLGLRSTDFSVSIDGDNITITTFGYGHGVGMSQSGANELAKMSKDYKYILSYYYNTDEFANIYV